MAILAHEYINKLLKPIFKIRQSNIALNQTLTLKLGVTLVLTVTQVYVFVNLRRVTSAATLRAQKKTSEKRPTSLQGTNGLSPMCPLLGAFAVFRHALHCSLSVPFLVFDHDFFSNFLIFLLSHAGWDRERWVGSLAR